MNVLVTGCAGFIGSTLTERCLAEGWTVRGIDSFTDYYARSDKLANLNAVQDDQNFTLIEADLLDHDLDSLLDGVDAIFHQAGQPGVRGSWADGFDPYLAWNVRATQRLLEAAVNSSVARFVYASSSSVYGATKTFPTTEETLPAPRSPYGVTKLAGEHLVSLYAANFGLSTVSLRYFTVYGPRQRPDMATHRLLHCGLTGAEFSLFGDGAAVRDFTYVDDIVDANIKAAIADVPAGSVMNIAGGSSVSMNDLIEAAERAIDGPIRIARTDVARGDVPRTHASTRRAEDLLSWSPKVDLDVGLAKQARRISESL